MQVLKENCSHCGGFIFVSMYVDPVSRKEYVDHATCLGCGKKFVLPNELFSQFVKENCQWLAC